LPQLNYIKGFSWCKFKLFLLREDFLYEVMRKLETEVAVIGAAEASKKVEILGQIW